MARLYLRSPSPRSLEDAGATETAETWGLLMFLHVTFLASIVIAIVVTCYLNNRSASAIRVVRVPDPASDDDAASSSRSALPTFRAALSRIVCCPCRKASDFVDRWCEERVSTDGYDAEYLRRAIRRIEDEKEAGKENPDARGARLRAAFREGGMVWELEEKHFRPPLIRRTGSVFDRVNPAGQQAPTGSVYDRIDSPTASPSRPRNSSPRSSSGGSVSSSACSDGSGVVGVDPTPPATPPPLFVGVVDPPDHATPPSSSRPRRSPSPSGRSTFDGVDPANDPAARLQPTTAASSSPPRKSPSSLSSSGSVFDCIDPAERQQLRPPSPHHHYLWGNDACDGDALSHPGEISSSGSALTATAPLPPGNEEGEDGGGSNDGGGGAPFPDPEGGGGADVGNAPAIDGASSAGNLGTANDIINPEGECPNDGGDGRTGKEDECEGDDRDHEEVSSATEENETRGGKGGERNPPLGGVAEADESGDGDAIVYPCSVDDGATAERRQPPEGRAADEDGLRALPPRPFVPDDGGAETTSSAPAPPSATSEHESEDDAGGDDDNEEDSPLGKTDVPDGGVDNKGESNAGDRDCDTDNDNDREAVDPEAAGGPAETAPRVPPSPLACGTDADRAAPPSRLAIPPGDDNSGNGEMYTPLHGGNSRGAREGDGGGSDSSTATAEERCVYLRLPASASPDENERDDGGGNECDGESSPRKSVPKECAICLCDYEPGDTLVVSSSPESASCPHAFHQECIVEWLAKMQEGTPCPLCRRQFVELGEGGGGMGGRRNGNGRRIPERMAFNPSAISFW